jgi:hypothetical protein
LPCGQLRAAIRLNLSVRQQNNCRVIFWGTLMRRFLLIFGLLSVIGSVGDGLISLYALWVVGSGGWADPGIQVGPLLEQYLPALYRVKDVARYVLPASVVTWVFNLPALVYFPVRVVMGCVIGWWVLAKAKSMSSSKSVAASDGRAAT